MALQQSVDTVKLKFENFKNNMNILSEQCAEDDIKISAIKNFLNPRQWFENFYKGEATLGSHYYLPGVEMVSGVIEQIKAFPSKLFSFSSPTAVSSINYPYSKTIQEMVYNVSNINKLIVSVHSNWEKKCQNLKCKKLRLKNY